MPREVLIQRGIDFNSYYFRYFIILLTPEHEALHVTKPCYSKTKAYKEAIEYIKDNKLKLTGEIRA